MTFDLTRIRAQTPGCAHVAHLNNAGAGLMPQPVLDAVVNHLQLEADIGGYEAVARQRDAIDHVYDAAAALINAHRDEIAIIENATRAWDMAFYSLKLEPGDRILTAMAEYPSNYIALLQRARDTGAVIEAIPDDEHGQISVDALRDMLDDRVKLVAITHVPTNGGLVNPVADIGRLTRDAGATYLLDACQSVGQLPIDVHAIGCDILAATGRKFLRGPRGTGFLYCRRDLCQAIEPVFLDIHAARLTSPTTYDIAPGARRFENWETYYAGKLGLAAAIDYALACDVQATWQRLASLAQRMRDQLAAIDGVTVHDKGSQRCGIVTFSMHGLDAKAIQQRLAGQQINVSITTLGDAPLDLGRRAVRQVVRASTHYYNTEAEVDALCRCVEACSPAARA